MKLVSIAWILCWSCKAAHEHDAHGSYFRGDSHNNHRDGHVRSMQAAAANSGTTTRDMLDPTDKDRATLNQALTLTNNPLNTGNDERELKINPPLKIPVCMHVVGDKISRQQLNKDFAALNKAFSSKSCCDTKLNWCAPAQCSKPATNITFVMAKLVAGKIRGSTNKPSSPFACVRQWRAATDMSQGEKGEWQVKSALRVGGLNVLNIYFAPNVTGTQVYFKPTYELGYTYFPKYSWTNAPLNLTLDGIVMNREAMVGSVIYPHYNEGDMLVHEVGHWLGLLDTYGIYWGSPDFFCDKGDGIADTPAAGRPNFGCAPFVKRDTCVDDPGLDPIFNYMDLSDDKCRYEWTQGQVDAMHASYAFYRSGVSRKPIKLGNGVASNKVNLGKNQFREFHFDLSPPSSLVKCEVVAEKGDIDLFLNTDGSYDRFDCMSISSDSTELCYREMTGTKAYVFVKAYSASENVVVKCVRVVTEYSETIDLAFNVSVTGIRYDVGVIQRYRLLGPTNVLERNGHIECTTQATGTADVDLYMDSIGDFYPMRLLCISAILGLANESCTTDSFYDEMYVFLLFASTSPNNVTLTCNCILPIELINATTLEHHQRVPFLEKPRFFMKVDTIQIVTCEARSPSPARTFYIRLFWNDASQMWVCRGFGTENATCTTSSRPGTGYVFVDVGQYQTNFYISCTTTEFQLMALVDHVESGLSTLNENMFAYYFLDVPNLATVDCRINCDARQFVLFLGWSEGSVTIERGSGLGALPPSRGTALATVWASWETGNYTIQCDTSLAT